MNSETRLISHPNFRGARGVERRAEHLGRVRCRGGHHRHADLGPDFYDRRGGTQRAIRNHIRHLPGGKFTDHVFGAMNGSSMRARSR